jgi:hypothetical protein
MIPAENIAGRRQGKAHVVAGMSRGVDALYFKIPDGKALSVSQAHIRVKIDIDTFLGTFFPML